MSSKLSDQVPQKPEQVTPGQISSSKFDDARTTHHDSTPHAGIAAAQDTVNQHFGHVTLEHSGDNSARKSHDNGALSRNHSGPVDAGNPYRTDTKPAEGSDKAGTPAEPTHRQPDVHDAQPAAYQPESSWTQRMQSDLNQAAGMAQRSLSNVESAVQAHYTNPYGTGWNADWNDIASPSPIDRRVVDGFRAMYDGVHDLVQNLNRGLTGG
jgi:hypothetical protein